MMKEELWHKNNQTMYQVDRYAKERVIKSVRMLLPYLKPGDIVLDVGCFTQEARKYLPSDCVYVGVDEKEYHPKTVCLSLDSDTSYLPIATHYICLETLEHLQNPALVLQSMVKSVSSYLVISLPNEATAFHRIRCMFGIVDGDCFGGPGKHLHLPSLGQSRAFLRQYFQIVREEYYISPSACGSKCSWVGRILQIVPDSFHQILADWCPSLFARGFIFLCKHKSTATN